MSADQVLDYNHDIPRPLPANASPEERARWSRGWASVAASAHARGVPDLEAFVRATKPDYDVQWFHRQIMQRLDQWLATPNDRLMLFMPPGFGKALALDTPIPTPFVGRAGPLPFHDESIVFRDLGDLKKGDWVFGRDGEPCRVVAAGEDVRGFCFRVREKGKEGVVAHGLHPWPLMAHDGSGDFLSSTLALSAFPGRKLRYADGVTTGHVTADDEGVRDCRCVQVDAPDECFLAGRDFLPTHNSELVSRRLPAYALGLNPDWWILNWSHTHELAKEIGLDVQRVMEGDEYRQLFPGTRIPAPGERTEGRRRRTDTYFEVVGRQGKYRAAGVGGAIAGRRFNGGIIDDPIRSVEDALSATMRAKVVREFSGAFATRQFPGARILITTTRYHNQDLCGWLLDLAQKGGEKYDVLAYPAVR